MNSLPGGRFYRPVILIGAMTLLAARGARADVALSLTGSSEPVSSPALASQPGSPPANLGSFHIVIDAAPELSGNAAALAAFQRAAARWEAFIADPITVTVKATLAPLAPNIIGSATSVPLLLDSAQVRNAIAADAGDEPDDDIATHLPTIADLAVSMPPGFGFDRSRMLLTKANAKAIGILGLDEQFGVPDSVVTFNTNFTFDFDNRDGVTPGQLDFETVASHEIGHALGFVSVLEYIDAVMSFHATAQDVVVSALDLFRFAAGAGNDPETDSQFTTFPRVLFPGQENFFDQVFPMFGLTEIAFSTGLTQGDGYQASHWKDNLGIGVMDPALAFGESMFVSYNDLRALDLMGYDISIANVSSTVPEAGAFLFVAEAMAAASACIALRRRWKR
jgi:hypothetical protein